MSESPPAGVTFVPKQDCMGCGYGPMNAATALDGGSGPEEGDPTICLNCGALHFFNADLSLRAAKRSEVDRLDPETAYEIGKMTGAILKRGRIADTGGGRRLEVLERQVEFKPRGRS